MDILEKEIIKKYGNAKIPVSEIKQILESAIQRRIISDYDIGYMDKLIYPMDATDLMEYISRIRREFLYRNLFDEDDNYNYKEDDNKKKEDNKKDNNNCKDNNNNCKDKDDNNNNINNNNFNNIINNAIDITTSKNNLHTNNTPLNNTLNTPLNNTLNSSCDYSSIFENNYLNNITHNKNSCKEDPELTEKVLKAYLEYENITRVNEEYKKSKYNMGTWMVVLLPVMVYFTYTLPPY